nr:thyakoid membrane protein [Cryptomonas curvata]
MSQLVLNFGFINSFGNINNYKNTKFQIQHKTNNISVFKASYNSFMGKNIYQVNLDISKFLHLKKHRNNNHTSKWSALIGPGGGLFGVGTSELIVIGAVAWLVLGPKRLYQLAKDIGKISGEIKNVAEEAKVTFQQAVDLETISVASSTKSNLSKNDAIKSKNSNNISNKKALVDLDELVQKEIKDLEKS